MSGGEIIPQAWVQGILDNLTGEGGFLRHIRHQMEEARLSTLAHQSKVRADWYCSLPWYRQWWALVTGR